MSNNNPSEEQVFAERYVVSGDAPSAKNGDFNNLDEAIRQAEIAAKVAFHSFTVWQMIPVAVVRVKDVTVERLK